MHAYCSSVVSLILIVAACGSDHSEAGRNHSWDLIKPGLISLHTKLIAVPSIGPQLWFRSDSLSSALVVAMIFELS